MRTTIEELYYGNIMPYNRSVRAGSEYANLVGLLARNEVELLGTLNEAPVLEIVEINADVVSTSGINLPDIDLTEI